MSCVFFEVAVELNPSFVESSHECHPSILFQLSSSQLSLLLGRMALTEDYASIA